MFQIKDFVQLDSNNRAICPACHLSKGAGYTKRNLVVFDNGAYKCHRGCTPEEIRAALGQQKSRPLPQALAKPASKASTITPRQVAKANEQLMESNKALPWLLERGIPKEAIAHFRLGISRAQCGKRKVPAISIPIPTDDDRTHYYQKKRVAPWLANEEQPEGYKAWSQYGIPQMVYFTHRPASATETYLCEGEWDAIRLGWELRNCDEVAVACFTCGAGNVPPDDQLNRLPGKVSIFYDLDEPGQKGAAKVQHRLGQTSFVATTPHTQNAQTGWDISDALSNGFTIADISEAANNATPWTEPKRENSLRSRLLTNDELLARAQDFVEWLVPDILTQDELFILGMPPRGGKSLFGLTLAKAVATGGTFLDRPVTQGSVIYINLEDSETKIKQRQIAQGWGENLPVYWLDKFKLSQLEELTELCEELPDLRLIIMDTFSRVRDDGTKESSAELGQILEPLQEFAKHRGVTVLLTHHTGKASNVENHGVDPFDMLRGSTAIRATCRGALVIVPGEGAYRLLAENGYSDRLDVSVRIHPETLEWKLLGNWAPRVDGDMKAQILDHLNLVGDATVADIAKALNFNANSVSTIMSRLHRDNVVSKRGGGGRAPSTYTRSSNLLKQLETQFEHPNPSPTESVDFAQTNNLSKNTSPKVDNLEKSGQSTVHFPEMSPRHTKLFEQSQESSPVSDSRSNSQNESLSKFGQTQAKISVYTEGGQVHYVGDSPSMSKVCGRKKLTIIAVEDDRCEVTHKGWVVTQTIPKTDLQLAK